MKLKSIFSSSFIIVSALSLIACTNKNETTNTADTSAAATSNTSTKIAFINLDSLDANYQYIIDGKEKFKQEQTNMEAELKKLEGSIQSQYRALQKKIDDKSISQVEYEEIGKRIQTMEQSYQQKGQALSGQFMAKTDSFQMLYRKKVDDFLSEYNKDGKYDYILTYQYGGTNVLYANKSLDITRDVVNGLNALYKGNGGTSSSSASIVTDKPSK